MLMTYPALKWGWRCVVVKCLFQYLADDALFILRLLNCGVLIRFWKAAMKCPDCISATPGINRYTEVVSRLLSGRTEPAQVRENLSWRRWGLDLSRSSEQKCQAARSKTSPQRHGLSAGVEGAPGDTQGRCPFTLRCQPMQPDYLLNISHPITIKPGQCQLPSQAK